MNTNHSLEHFVTLFDNNFLPLGLCLHASLMQHAQPFCLWILCMDEEVQQNLRILNLPNIRLIPLKQAETEALLRVKAQRSRGEYCWTLTPFTPQMVFDRDETARRVTYLDTDLFFFDNPRVLLDEFSDSHKDIMLTDHAYDPRYDQSETNGRFCVQFLSFRDTARSHEVMKWWQERCIEWCFARLENGKFGDQKYLDQWPVLFGDAIHITTQTDKTLAPWNVAMFAKQAPLNPVFYHFQSLRIVSSKKVHLYSGYHVGEKGLRLYEIYLESLRQNIKILNQHAIPVPWLPLSKEGSWQWLRYVKRKITGTTKFANLISK